jgi:GT2 family glycosyltransferase
MLLAIIIVNYRTPQLVIDCLASLADQIGEDDLVIVVDSASGDGSPERIMEAARANGWEWLELMVLMQNRGFAAANNVGMREMGHADALLLLNSDTIVRPGALAELRRAFDENPRAGAISPRLEWPDGTPQISCFREIRPITELLAAARTGPISTLFRRYEIPLPVSDIPMQPEWTSFAAVMLRTTAAARVGLLDEGYFMYFEDVDYCRLLRRIGWQIVHWPAARVVHLRGGSSAVKAATANRERRPAYYYAARARYFAAWYGRSGLWRANLLWHAGRIVSWLREKLGHKEPHTCAHEGRDIWYNWRDPLKPWDTTTP